jgi:voltage-gated potassium channel
MPRQGEREHVDAEKLQRFARWSEWPLAILALLILPSLLLDDPSRSVGFHHAVEALNWVVWLAFCGELGVKAWLSANPSSFLRHAWLDLLIVIFSPPFFGPEYLGGLRAVRAFRLLRFLRLARVLAVAGIALESARDVLQHRKIHYVALITTVVISLGALSIYGAEHGQNPNIKSVGDAFWWSIVTATTVGYGDVSPTTTEGRFIAVGLMLVGIGFISILTATMASFFFEEEHYNRTAEAARMEARLVRLEENQNELLVLVRAQNSLYAKPAKPLVHHETTGFKS